MAAPTKTSLLLDGLTDAVGFLVGALIGMGAGRVFGLELFTGVFSVAAVMSLLLIAAGGGLGLQLARRLRRHRTAETGETEERSRSGKP